MLGQAAPHRKRGEVPFRHWSSLPACAHTELYERLFLPGRQWLLNLRLRFNFGVCGCAAFSVGANLSLGVGLFKCN